MNRWLIIYTRTHIRWIDDLVVRGQLVTTASLDVLHITLWSLEGSVGDGCFLGYGPMVDRRPYTHAHAHKDTDGQIGREADRWVGTLLK
jgi:hypothetical protein